MTRAQVTGITLTGLALTLSFLTGCAQRTGQTADPQPKAFGAQLVLVSGEKQIDGVGAPLDQPVIVQVNTAEGGALAGALVKFAASGGVTFAPDRGLTGADGQFTTAVSLGTVHGRYQLVAFTRDARGKAVELKIDEIALGYQELLGQRISEVHCVRCHESESSAERVSNHDNLSAPAHSFTDGSVLNPMSDAKLTAIIGHGGPALGKSPEMPPYGDTLSRPEVSALVALLRAVADPPYRPQGVFYANH